MSDTEIAAHQQPARAAVNLPTGEPPSAQREQRRHRRAAFTSVTAVVATVAAVAGLAVATRRGADPRPPQQSALTLPGYAGPKVTLGQLAGYRWRSLPTAPIASRSASAAVWTGRQLIVWGGSRGNDSRGNEQYADGASYDPSRRTWTKLPPAPISGRSGAVATYLDGNMIIWGAYPDPTRPLGDGARYDVQARSWHLLPPVSDAPGYYAAALVTAGSHAVLLRMHQSGNVSRPADTIVRADAYDVRTDTWQRLPDFTELSTHQILEVDALGVGSTVFVWASWVHTVSVSPNATSTTFGVDAARLDVGRGGSWRPVAARPDPEASARGPQWTGHRILLPQTERYCGDCSGPAGYRTRSLLIDPRTGRRTASTIPPQFVGGDVVVWTGGAVLDVADTGAGKGRTAAFDPRTGRWRTLAPAPGNQQFDSVSIWAGRRLIQWGNGDGPASAAGTEFAPA